MNFFETTRNFVLDIFFPRICLGCKKSIKENILCDECFQKIPLRNGFVCAVCGGRLPLLKKTCHPKAPYILGTATDYDGVVREMISQLKYKNVQEAAPLLADLVTRYMHMINFRPENQYIVPIPLHAARQRTRGFNQAELVAQKISREFSIPVLDNALIRTKNTAPQSHLSTRDEKQQNMREAFMVRSPERIAKKNIVLFDDITTTGATLQEAARALKTAGARRITALVIAKA